MSKKKIKKIKVNKTLTNADPAIRHIGNKKNQYTSKIYIFSKIIVKI